MKTIAFLVAVLIATTALPADAAQQRKNANQFTAGNGCVNYGSNPGSDPVILAMGDSVTQGYNDYEQGGYANRYAKTKGATLCKLARGGSPSSYQVSVLQSGTADALLKQADEVIMETGGVDMIGAHTACGANVGCYPQYANQTVVNWQSIANQIKTKAPNAQFHAITFYDPWVGVDSSSVHAAFKQALQDTNKRVAAVVSGAGGQFADYYQVFNGPSGDEDPVKKGFEQPNYDVHPTPQGHQVIANQL